MNNIDMIKLILSLLVVLLHVNGTIFQGMDGLTIFNHWIGSLAVPCFLVYSGYFFSVSLKKRDLKTVTSSYVKRLLILSLVYQSIWICFLMPNGNGWTRFVASDDRVMFLINICFEYLCDGLYQFWYITAALMGIMLMAWFIHRQKETWGVVLSIVVFISSVLVSTWYIPFVSDILIWMVQPIEMVWSAYEQSVASAWLFLWIGYYHEKVGDYWSNHRWIYGLTIMLYLMECILYQFGFGGSISLWLTSPLMACAILVMTTGKQIKINSSLAVFLRHLSTLIYCIHYQLSMVFANSFTQGTMRYDPLVTPILYFGLLLGISLMMVLTIQRLTSHNKHHWLTYLF